jgi:hypothetical protein
MNDEYIENILPILPIVQDFWDIMYIQIYYYRSIKHNLYISYRHVGRNTNSLTAEAVFLKTSQLARLRCYEKLGDSWKCSHSQHSGMVKNPVTILRFSWSYLIFNFSLQGLVPSYTEAVTMSQCILQSPPSGRIRQKKVAT